jgi:hypothetical protein
MSVEAENKPGTHSESIIARLASRNRGLKDQNRTLAEKLAKLEGDATTAAAELERLRTASDPNGLATRVKDLEGQIRTRAHRDAFDRLAKEAGVKPGAIEDLFQLSGYKAESDDVDEAAIGQVLAAQKTQRGHLFADPAAPPGTPAPPAPPKPGPAGGKGGTTASGAPVVSEDLVKSDPAYVMKNYSRVVAAAKSAAGIE